MLFFKKKPAAVSIAAIVKSDILIEIERPLRKPAKKPDSDGRLRRIGRVVEDNRLL